MGKIILLYIHFSRWQISCQMALIIRDSLLDCSFQNKLPVRILEHICLWDLAFTLERLGNGRCKPVSSTGKKPPTYLLCAGMMLDIGSSWTQLRLWHWWQLVECMLSNLSSCSPVPCPHHTVWELQALLPETYLFSSDVTCNVLVRLVFYIFSPSQNAANVLMANLHSVSFVWLLWLSSS